MVDDNEDADKIILHFQQSPLKDITCSDKIYIIILSMAL